MPLITELYQEQQAYWPQAGRHILAQYDEESVVVYQAYRPAIGHFAAQHSYFGGEFSLERMSWIKPNFLWMMYRSGWGTKPGQEVTLAVRLKREALIRSWLRRFIPVTSRKFTRVKWSGTGQLAVQTYASNGIPTMTRQAKS